MSLLDLLKQEEVRSERRKQERLVERARILCERAAAPAAAGRARRLVTFALSRTVYGLPIEDVKDFVQLRSLTAIPGAASHVAGVIAWRGALLAVLDLTRRLGLPSLGIQDFEYVVVVRSADGEVGLLIEQLNDIVDVSHDELRPGLGPPWQRSVTASRVVVLNLPWICSSST